MYIHELFINNSLPFIKKVTLRLPRETEKNGRGDWTYIEQRF